MSYKNVCPQQNYKKKLLLQIVSGKEKIANLTGLYRDLLALKTNILVY